MNKFIEADAQFRQRRHLAEQDLRPDGNDLRGRARHLDTASRISRRHSQRYTAKE